MVKKDSPIAPQLFFKGKLSVVSTDDNSVRIEGLTAGRGSITVRGTGNVVEFGEDSLLNGTVSIQGDNNRVTIGAHCAIRGSILVKGAGQTVSIGERTTFQSVYILCQESCNVTIGRWCMFSREIEVRTTDAHSVIEVSSGQRLNLPASVEIGDHVWVSVGVLVSKGVKLPDDCIVGAQSFVNGTFTETNILIAGAPAKVLKRGVTWNRSRRASFSKDEMNAWRLPAVAIDSA